MIAAPFRYKAVLLDIDGTLLDSNDAHATAWIDVLTSNGHAVDFKTIRALIGKGGDKLLREAVNVDSESSHGKQLSEQRQQLFAESLLADLQPMAGARALLKRLQRDGLALVIATSAGSKELELLLKQAGVDDLIDASAGSGDVEASKPDPDIVQAALQRCGCAPHEVFMIGDTPYDIESATRAGVAAVALRCGGWWTDEELDGALEIADDPADLLDRLDRLAFYQR